MRKRQVQENGMTLPTNPNALQELVIVRGFFFLLLPFLHRGDTATSSHAIVNAFPDFLDLACLAVDNEQ
jgi:hypothetical protein